ncbi:MAG TPA: anaerobic ribonucleoside-triphosphate reductase [Candidatus Acidoferrum sp.]|nr:anaerobic ribonucleoside-triphosphate reductase [Candidatus Acidoferrum sp.]
MSVPHRIRGVRVLKAVSSSLRLQILNFLFDKGPLSYTELMSSLKMNPSRDAGRFAYHLKFLLKADLIEADVETRKYGLTELGKMVIDVADRIEKSSSKSKGMLVRASRFALEEFDANRIADSLVREARMSSELAQKVSKEAEKRLLKSKTKYLTAPLVREMVNSILIEKGLEEYRHRLTRLGLPVHEVTMLIEARSSPIRDAESMRNAAGDAVLREYMLLKAFPRDISDAHMAGLLHINGLSSWITKPDEVVHDMRFFYENGLELEKLNVFQPSFFPPQTLESALSATFNVLAHSADEVARAQTLDYFNVFLAPFAKNVDPQRIKEAFQLFIFNLNQLADTSLCLELSLPGFIAAKPCVGPMGKHTGKYGDFAEEVQLLASVILDLLIEQNQRKPLLQPRIVVKIRTETFTDERARTLLLKAHRLVSEKGLIYFASVNGKSEEQTVFSGLGHRFTPDLNDDWETDTLRTGCLASVTINLPRIAYECEKDDAKFVGILQERLELAARAMEIKNAALKQNGGRLLPFLLQNINGDQYLRLENSSRLINLIGLEEALKSCYGGNLQDEKTRKLTEKIVQSIGDFTRKAGKRRTKRLHPSLLPDREASERLAHLDIDRYGFGKVKYSGTREKPFYSMANTLHLREGLTPAEPKRFDTKIMKGLQTGGCLTVIDLEDTDIRPDELIAMTKQIAEDPTLSFFTYNRKLTYCSNCRKSWPGLLHKCPSCSATSTLTYYDRFMY